MNDHVIDPYAREYHSLQQGTLSSHVVHSGNEDREIPQFELQSLISPTGHGKSARPKVIQGDGSGGPRVHHITFRENVHQIWIGPNLALAISMFLNLSEQLYREGSRPSAPSTDQGIAQRAL